MVEREETLLEHVPDKADGNPLTVLVMIHDENTQDTLFKVPKQG